MARRAYNVQRALRDLVLDLPLYSASLEHMTDRCGNTLYGFGDGMAAQTATIGGLTGVQMPASYSSMPQWTFEPITDGCFTYSYFFCSGGLRGHGWAWECLTLGGGVGTVNFTCATTSGGRSNRLFAGLSGYGGATCDYGTTSVHFVTAVVEGAFVELYMDGALVATGNKNKSRSFDCVGLRWAVSDLSNSSTAVFRQFKLFRRTLTADEVAALYVEEQKYLTAA